MTTAISAGAARQATGPGLKTTIMLAALIMALAVGIRQCFGLFQASVAADLGMTGAGFGFALALHNLAWGVSQPVVGMLADRHGPRPALLVWSAP